MTQYQDLLQKQVAGNTVQDLLIATAVFVGAYVLLFLFRTIVIGKLHKFAGKTSFKFDDAIVEVLKRISVFFYISVSLYIATRYLVLSSVVDNLVYGLLIVVLVLEAIRVIQKIIMFFVEHVWLKDSAGQEHMSHILGLLIKLALWTVGLLLILSNLGVDITSLIASLGIGGVAIALALQNILGDMFSSFSIYFDQPFRVGDFIIVGDHMGTVKKIGLKTTRIEALQGEEIVISNTELTSTRVRNFKKMSKRRIVFAFGVTYDTPVAKLKKIPEIVGSCIDPLEHAEMDRAHFKSFGDSSLDYEVVYFVKTGDYKEYMDTQQTINISILDKFEKEGIEMAFPTRTVYLNKGD
jgi:small-conductance mechanosensitive channel